MCSVRRTLPGLFLAALLLAWSCVGAAGLISYCSGDGDEGCSHGMVHLWTGSEGVPSEECPVPCRDEAPCQDESPAPSGGTNAWNHQTCGCPPDHQHETVSLEMGLLPALTLAPPLWKELPVWPQAPRPPERGICLDLPVSIPEGMVPGPAPLHLSQAPLLI